MATMVEEIIMEEEDTVVEIIIEMTGIIEKEGNTIAEEDIMEEDMIVVGKEDTTVEIMDIIEDTIMDIAITHIMVAIIAVDVVGRKTGNKF